MFLYLHVFLMNAVHAIKNKYCTSTLHGPIRSNLCLRRVYINKNSTLMFKAFKAAKRLKQEPKKVILVPWQIKALTSTGIT